MTDTRDELREAILTLGICNGPYDSPHRCSALHCNHCGLCDLSEDLLQLFESWHNRQLDQVVREAQLQELLLAINFWRKTMGDISLKVKAVNGYMGDRIEQLNQEPQL